MEGHENLTIRPTSSDPWNVSADGIVPLAMHGGPLWEPLCYAQIGGLTAATFITLLLVPVFYSICVLDLKIIRWERSKEQSELPTELERLQRAAGGAI